MSQSNLTRIAKPLDFIVEAIGTVLKYITVALTISFVVVMIAAVWSRYVVNSSLIWTEEYIRFSLFWLVFLASALVSYDDEHLRIELFQNMLPPLWQKAADLLVKALILVFLIILVWQSIELFNRTTGRSPALRLPMAWVYAAMIFGGVLIAIMTIRSMFVRREINSEDTFL